MLKIKDSVDLKELEKFGWWDKNAYKLEYESLKDRYYPEYRKGKFTVQKNRRIRSCAGNQWHGLDDLFDIIQAGLVEKVEDK